MATPSKKRPSAAAKILGGEDPGLDGEACGLEAGAVDADVGDQRRAGGDHGDLYGMASPGAGGGGGAGGYVGGDVEEDPARRRTVEKGQRRRCQRGAEDGALRHVDVLFQALLHVHGWIFPSFQAIYKTIVQVYMKRGLLA